MMFVGPFIASFLVSHGLAEPPKKVKPVVEIKREIDPATTPYVPDVAPYVPRECLPR